MLVRRVSGANLTIDQARQRLKAARALARSSTSAFIPEVALSGSATGGSGRSYSNDFARRPLQANLEVGWEIPLFGQQASAKSAGEIAAAMAADDLDASKLAISVEVASTYMHLRALQQIRRNIEKTATLVNETISVGSAKQTAGLTIDVENELLKSNLRDLDTQKLVVHASIENTLQRIATLQGVSVPDDELRIERPQPIMSDYAPAGPPADLLRLRPDVKRAELAVLQAGVDLGVAKQDLYPKLHLSGTLGIGSPVEGALFGLFGGPSLQIPIFDNGRRKDIVIARRAQLDEALSLYKQTVLAAYEEAAAAMRAVETAKARTSQLELQLASSKRIENRASVLLRAGLADASKQLDASASGMALQRQLIDSKEEEAQAILRFVKAVGDASAIVAPDRADATVSLRQRS